MRIEANGGGRRDTRPPPPNPWERSRYLWQDIPKTFPYNWLETAPPQWGAWDIPNPLQYLPRGYSVAPEYQARASQVPFEWVPELGFAGTATHEPKWTTPLDPFRYAATGGTPPYQWTADIGHPSPGVFLHELGHAMEEPITNPWYPSYMKALLGTPYAATAMGWASGYEGLPPQRWPHEIYAQLPNLIWPRQMPFEMRKFYPWLRTPGEW